MRKSNDGEATGQRASSFSAASARRMACAAKSGCKASQAIRWRSQPMTASPTRGGTRKFRLRAVRPQGKDMLVAQVEGVDDRAGAEALNRVELYVARDKLPAPEEDEFYIADLIGLRAETADGANDRRRRRGAQFRRWRYSGDRPVQVEKTSDFSNEPRQQARRRDAAAALHQGDDADHRRQAGRVVVVPTDGGGRAKLRRRLPSNCAALLRFPRFMP